MTSTDVWGTVTTPAYEAKTGRVLSVVVDPASDAARRTGQESELHAFDSENTPRAGFVECLWIWDPLSVSNYREVNPGEYDDLTGFAVATARSYSRDEAAKRLASFVGSVYLEVPAEELLEGATGVIDCIRQRDRAQESP